MSKTSTAVLIAALLFSTSCYKRLYIKSEATRDQAIRHYENIQLLNINKRMLLLQQADRANYLKDSIRILELEILKKEELLKNLR